MDRAVDKAIETRRKYVEAWNRTLLDIWQERIHLLKVYDTGALWRSIEQLPIRHDGRFVDLTLSQSFLEYGIYQDLGTGREVPRGNPGDIGRSKVREPRRWFSPKYYMSVMALRDFLADSIGDEFVGIFSTALDDGSLRSVATNHSHR